MMAQPATLALETAWLLELAEHREEYLPQLKTVCLHRKEIKGFFGEALPGILSEEQLRMVLKVFGKVGICLTGLSNIPSILEELDGFP